MSYTKTIVCLANSWKNTNESDGRCVAGRVYEKKAFGEWIRPVSDRNTHEVSGKERAYEGSGGDPEVLDVIEFPMSAPQPEGHQRENHVIDRSERWRKVGRLSWKQIQAAVETPSGSLWRNDRSSSKGKNDGVTTAGAAKLTRSLYLVRPTGLVLSKAKEPGWEGKPARIRVRARFSSAASSTDSLSRTRSCPDISTMGTPRYRRPFSASASLPQVSGAIVTSSSQRLLRRRAQANEMTRTVFTVGHSTHSLEKMLELLRRNEITAIADVRSQSYSRINPQFNREPFQSTLKNLRIDYAFLGRELGARSDDRSCYVDGKVQYDRLAQTELFQAGLMRVEQGAGRYRIALMCAEKDPLTCHRTILVVRHLVARGLEAAHVLEDGRLEKHEAALERLLRETGATNKDLFKPRQELVDEAYTNRANEIAYVEKTGATSEGAPERYAP